MSKGFENNEVTENSLLMAGVNNKSSDDLILIVEDNEVNQELLKNQLTLLGYKADVAESGVDAIKMLNEDRYSLVLTDSQMPMMNGVEMTRIIRSKEFESKNHIPIISISANSFQDEIQLCLDEGMDDYIVKPIDLSGLKMVLEKWLT